MRILRRRIGRRRFVPKRHRPPDGSKNRFGMENPMNKPNQKLGFGLMRMPLTNADDPTSVDFGQVCTMVDTFLERGFTYFDTAYMYHNGVSEEIAGRALVDRHPRASFTLTTKLPVVMLKSEADNERIFSDQLRKCHVSYFDYYLLHCLTKENFEKAERLHCFEFVQRLKAEGKVKCVGFSFHDTADVLEQILRAHPEIEFVQLQINYLDWEDPQVQSRLCYEVCEKYGKPVIVMEPVKGGTLASIPAAAEALMKEACPDASVASWAVRYAASRPSVFVVLSGMSTLGQLLDNTSYMRSFRPLSAQEEKICEQAARIIRDKTEIACTGCAYCTEGCPRHIAIPKYFALYNEWEREGRKNDAPARYAALTKEFGKASDCIRCRQCERHCPQHLPITKYLESVARGME